MVALLSAWSCARKFRIVLAAVCLTAIAGLPLPAAAQETTKFDAAEAKVEALAAENKLDAAIAASRQLVASARRALKKDPKLAIFLTELSALESQRGHLPEAEAAAREALAINSEVAEPNSPLVLRSLAALAEVLAKGNPDKLAEAGTILARAIAAGEDSQGPDSPQIGDLQRRLADVLEHQGRKAEADQLRAGLEVSLAASVQAERAQAADQMAKQEIEAESSKAGANEGGKGGLPLPEEAAPSPGAPQTSAGGGASESPGPVPKKKFRHLAVPKPEPTPEANAPLAAPPPPPPPAAATAAAPQPQQDYHVVDVFFGTNREAAQGNGRVTFTDSKSATMALGQARITIPAKHEVPNVERPWSLNVPFTQIVLSTGNEDPSQYFTIQSISTLSEDQFLAHAKAQLAQSKTYKDQALVFVHGYYNKFDDALYRTAQIAYDMQFDGAAFMFSWPSAGTVDAYSSDHKKAERAGPQLRAFLDLVAHKTGAKRITVIAHSMGNLPLMEALDETVPGALPSPDAAIDDIVLAAPDIGRKEFADLASHVSHLRGGMTLYAASNDLALAASRTINGENRAGDTWPGGPLVLPHIDTIDATSTSLQMFRLNHFYIAQSSEVLCDVERLLRTGLHPPDARTRLIAPVTAAAGGLYYSFR